MQGRLFPTLDSSAELTRCHTHEVESPIALHICVAEETSVAVCYAIRATVGYVFHGADGRDFLELTAMFLCYILFTSSILSLAKIGPLLQVVSAQRAFAGIGDTIGSTDGIVDHGAGHHLSAILQRGGFVLAAVKLRNLLSAPPIVLFGNAGSQFNVVGTQRTVVAVGDAVSATDLLQDEGAGGNGFTVLGIAQVLGAVKRGAPLLASSIVALLNLSPMLCIMGTNATLVVISKSVCATDWEQNPWAAHQEFATSGFSCWVLITVNFRNLLPAFSIMLLADMGPLLCIVGADPAFVVIGETIGAANRAQDPWAGYQSPAILRDCGWVLTAVNRADLQLAFSIVQFGNVGVMFCVVGANPTFVVISEAI